MTSTCLLEHSSSHASPCLWREAVSSFRQRNIPLRRRLMTMAFEVRESRERNAVVHCRNSPSPGGYGCGREILRTDDSSSELIYAKQLPPIVDTSPMKGRATYLDAVAVPKPLSTTRSWRALKKNITTYSAVRSERHTL
jgi:hypothetical protein